MASSLPATTISMSLSAVCSMVGLTTNASSTRATRTSAMGPSNGAPASISAADAPTPASTSALYSSSAEITYAIICVSCKKPSGNSGRSDRSTSRDDRTSLSVGRPSRLMNPPGIFPPAENFSRYSTVRGKKLCPSRTSFEITAVHNTMVSPSRTTADPPACRARRPVSSERTLPGASSISLWVKVAICSFSSFSFNDLRVVFLRSNGCSRSSASLPSGAPARRMARKTHAAHALAHVHWGNATCRAYGFICECPIS